MMFICDLCKARYEKVIRSCEISMAKNSEGSKRNFIPASRMAPAGLRNRAAKSASSGKNKQRKYMLLIIICYYVVKSA